MPSIKSCCSANPLYDRALIDWHRVERAARADGAKPRTEVLWINPSAAKRLQSPSMFADGVLA